MILWKKPVWMCLGFGGGGDTNTTPSGGGSSGQSGKTNQDKINEIYDEAEKAGKEVEWTDELNELVKNRDAIYTEPTTTTVSPPASPPKEKKEKKKKEEKKTIGQVSPNGLYAGDGSEWVDSGQGYLTRTYTGEGKDNNLGKDVIAGNTAPNELKETIAAISLNEGSDFAGSVSSATDRDIVNVLRGEEIGSSSYAAQVGQEDYQDPAPEPVVDYTPTTPSLEESLRPQARPEDVFALGDPAAAAVDYSILDPDPEEDLGLGTEPISTGTGQVTMNPVTGEITEFGTPEAEDLQEFTYDPRGPEQLPSVEQKQSSLQPPVVSPDLNTLDVDTLLDDGGFDLDTTGLRPSTSDFVAPVVEVASTDQAAGIPILNAAEDEYNKQQALKRGIDAAPPGLGSNVEDMRTAIDQLREYDDLGYLEKLYANYISDAGVKGGAPGGVAGTLIGDMGVEALAGINETFGNTVGGAGLFLDQLVERYTQDPTKAAGAEDQITFFQDALSPIVNYYSKYSPENIRTGDDSFVNPGLSEGRKDQLEGTQVVPDASVSDVLTGKALTASGDTLLESMKKNPGAFAVKASGDFYDVLADVFLAGGAKKLGTTLVALMSGSEGGYSANEGAQNEITRAINAGEVDLQAVANQAGLSTPEDGEAFLRNMVTNEMWKPAVVAGVGDALVARVAAPIIPKIPGPVVLPSSLVGGVLSGGTTEGAEQVMENVGTNVGLGAAGAPLISITKNIGESMVEGALAQGVGTTPTVVATGVEALRNTPIGVAPPQGAVGTSADTTTVAPAPAPVVQTGVDPTQSPTSGQLADSTVPTAFDDPTVDTAPTDGMATSMDIMAAQEIIDNSIAETGTVPVEVMTNLQTATGASMELLNDMAMRSTSFPPDSTTPSDLTDEVTGIGGGGNVQVQPLPSGETMLTNTATGRQEIVPEGADLANAIAVFDEVTTPGLGPLDLTSDMRVPEFSTTRTDPAPVDLSGIPSRLNLGETADTVPSVVPDAEVAMDVPERPAAPTVADMEPRINLTDAVSLSPGDIAGTTDVDLSSIPSRLTLTGAESMGPVSDEQQGIRSLIDMKRKDYADLEAQYGTGIRPGWVSAELASIQQDINALQSQDTESAPEIDQQPAPPPALDETPAPPPISERDIFEVQVGDSIDGFSVADNIGGKGNTTDLDVRRNNGEGSTLSGEPTTIRDAEYGEPVVQVIPPYDDNGVVTVKVGSKIKGGESGGRDNYVAASVTISGYEGDRQDIDQATDIALENWQQNYENITSSDELESNAAKVVSVGEDQAPSMEDQAPSMEELIAERKAAILEHNETQSDESMQRVADANAAISAAEAGTVEEFDSTPIYEEEDTVVELPPFTSVREDAPVEPEFKSVRETADGGAEVTLSDVLDPPADPVETGVGGLEGEILGGDISVDVKEPVVDEGEIIDMEVPIEPSDIPKISSTLAKTEVDSAPKTEVDSAPNVPVTTDVTPGVLMTTDDPPDLPPDLPPDPAQMTKDVEVELPAGLPFMFKLGVQRDADGNIITECPEGYLQVEGDGGPMCQRTFSINRQRAGASTNPYTGVNTGKRRGPGQKRKDSDRTVTVMPISRKA